MPVILNEADYDLWLDPAIDDRAKLEKLIKPFAVKTMNVRPVRTYVNNVKNQGEECVANRIELRDPEESDWVTTS